MIKDVHIVITRETMPLTQAGFGMPLIVGVGENTVEYTECTSPAEVEEAGYGTDSTVYDMASAMFAQSPSPPIVAVANVEKDDVNATATITAEDGSEIYIEATGLDIDGADGNDVTVEVVNDPEEDFSVSYDSTDKDLTIELGGEEKSASEIAGDIDGLDDFKAILMTDGYFTEDDIQEVDFSGGKDGSVVSGLNNLIEKHNDWYFLLSDSQDEQEMKDLAVFAAANKKLYFAQPDKDVDDTISLADDMASVRAVIEYHDDENETLAAAKVGKCAPEDPGSITWKFKNLNGVSKADVGVTDVNKLHAGNCNTYIRKLGVDQTSEGLTTGGEYIDIIRGQDWVEARMSEAVHRLLFTSPKVPYDNRGIAMVVSEVQSVLQQATDREIVARDDDGNGMWEVTAPNREDIPTNYIANRILPDVEFEFIAAGAIHEVKIRGVISL